ncbi:Arabinose 5-phosphate isomerase KdsD [Candidatus Desulfarcum epimagneticum]|uniref:Arabinose 5-phosphate isomerase KdsD n=1 Tax=uncultured Desulfobacteraceae bacterium TaxID=218296 RepID=A0A484HQA9_9BACT|nr:Arabinose 5-phosphate isomerase KdsD [uncultured Desulfobacteraceae bacterium]
MIIEEAKEVLQIEAEGILSLVDRIDDDFARMAELIYKATGRVIVAGIGKSGIVGRKIVATLNSTGTRSFFLHPVEAMHGDLGIVCPDDIFLALSNSGETEELNILVPSIKKIGCAVIAFTGKTDSTLAQNSDIVIDVGVAKEACPLGLAPTSSTTALLAMGDALAVVLINKKHFKAGDFKRFHPGGALGQRLCRKVGDLMPAGGLFPKVFQGAPMRDAVRETDRLELGLTVVVQKNGSLAGLITDGDIRRILLRHSDFLDRPVDDFMTKNPRSVHPDSPVYDALNIMERHQITALPIVGDGEKVEGILHLHEILGKGEFKFNGLQ